MGLGVRVTRFCRRLLLVSLMIFHRPSFASGDVSSIYLVGIDVIVPFIFALAIIFKAKGRVCKILSIIAIAFLVVVNFLFTSFIPFRENKSLIFSVAFICHILMLAITFWVIEKSRK